MTINEDYGYCEGHGVRVPIEWFLPDLDKPLFLGEKRLPAIFKNIVPKREIGIQSKVEIGYVLAKARELERKSRELLARAKLY